MENEKKYNYKKWGIQTIIIYVIVLCAVAGFTIVVDPYFHYHKPLKSLQYPFPSEWYVNDGIVRNFDYDALITGTSMTECFKTSEAEDLFNMTFIKVPYSGGSFSQTDRLVRQAVDKNSNLKMVIRGLDFSRLVYDDFTATRGDVPFPEYLYNANPFDDVQYVLNQDVLYNDTYGVIKYTNEGNLTTNFDDYVCWTSDHTFGKETLDSLYNRTETKAPDKGVTQADIDRVIQNVKDNVTDIASENPDVEFYYFITPYSIYYFDSQNQRGKTQYWLELHKAAIEEMLKYDNIKIFSFLDCYNVITNPDNYKDGIHYGEWVNSDMLTWMKNNEHLVTKDNIDDYYSDVSEFYTNFDYDNYFSTEQENAQ